MKMNNHNKTRSVGINALNLNKRFGDLIAVDNVSFSIFESEIVGILGPNGAGKTTTIRLLTGVFGLENNAKIEIFNQDITRNPYKYKMNFGIVPEVSNAFSDYTVWQNLKFSGGIYGMPKVRIEQRAKKLLKDFGLIDKRNSKTKTLSKGLKQRLNFCLALLHEPPILILDEPTSGLDPFSVKLMREQILQFKKEGKTILITIDQFISLEMSKIIISDSFLPF